MSAARACTHCGKPVTGTRVTCSAECLRERLAYGGPAAASAGRNRQWGPRATGDCRSVRTADGLEVLDPVALAAAGVRLVDCRGKAWEPL